MKNISVFNLKDLVSIWSILRFIWQDDNRKNYCYLSLREINSPVLFWRPAKGKLANSADADQNAASDRCIHCLQIV